MRKLYNVTIGTLCIAVAMLIATACSNSSTSDASSDASSTTSSVTSTGEGTVSKENSNTYQVLKNCWIGDEITFTDYRFAVESGVSMYYIEGRYVYTYDNQVVQLREEIALSDVGASVGAVISEDTRFNKEKATPAFYGSDGSYVTGGWDDTVTATTPNCVVEYVDWLDDTESKGIVQSYLFTYSKVPVKVSGFYEPQAEVPVTGEVSGAEVGSEADTGAAVTEGESDAAVESDTVSEGEAANSEAAVE